MPKSKDPTRFCCGHLREGNSTPGKWPQCRTCKRKYSRDYSKGEASNAREPGRKRAPKRVVENKPFLTPFGPDYALRMAEARVEYDAWLIRQEQLGKGGRPKNRRSDFRADPADALLSALGAA